MREFFGGFVVLGQGFRYWRKKPRLMLLGLLPAAIVALVLLALLALLGIWGASLAISFVERASAEDRVWTGIIALALVIIGVLVSAVLAAYAFTAITLLAGEPVYQKIWHAVELDLGDMPEKNEPGFWRAVRDAGRLVVQAIILAIVLAIISIIPFVGPPVAAVLGFFLSGRIIAVELTSRPLEARGITWEQRKRVLRSRNPRLIGFGVAAHLFYAIPLGAVFVMPAAVAGATIMARHALEAHGVLAEPGAAGFDTPASRATQPTD